MYTTLDEAITAFNVAMADVIGDMGGDGDDYAYDLIIGVAHDCTPKVARALCQTQLGFVPDACK